MAKGRKKKGEKLTIAGGDPDRPARASVPKVNVERPRRTKVVASRELTFGADTYKWMGIGFALVVVGLFLMAGGRGDNFTEFDPDVIYSPVKTTLAPIVILGGLGVVIYAILKK